MATLCPCTYNIVGIKYSILAVLMIIMPYNLMPPHLQTRGTRLLGVSLQQVRWPSCSRSQQLRWPSRCRTGVELDHNLTTRDLFSSSSSSHATAGSYTRLICRRMRSRIVLCVCACVRRNSPVAGSQAAGLPVPGSHRVTTM